MQIIPVILSGSLGTRLWLLSRKQYSKQYPSSSGDNTMLQKLIRPQDCYCGNMQDTTCWFIFVAEVNDRIFSQNFLTIKE
jgi:mannose-1-phosphate guanylyltransferase